MPAGSTLRTAIVYSRPRSTPTPRSPKKIVLAYSGGLDTSVILPRLTESYPGVKRVAFAAELGQGDELKNIEAKAYKSGATPSGTGPWCRPSRSRATWCAPWW